MSTAITHRYKVQIAWEGGIFTEVELSATDGYTAVAVATQKAGEKDFPFAIETRIRKVYCYREAPGDAWLSLNS